MYKAKNGLVNGGIVNELLSFCNEWFIDPFIQPHAGANLECMFCGCMKREGGDCDHSANCPSIRYHDIARSWPGRVEEQ